MSIPAAWPHVLDFFATPLVIEPSPGQLSGDAGLLPVRQFDQRIGLTRAFAEVLSEACGCTLGLRFRPAKLLDFRAAAEALERNPNPFAAVVLAQLK
jgi:hypothetical protein